MRSLAFKLVTSLQIILLLNIGLASQSSAFDSTPPKVESCTISPRQVSDTSGGIIRVTIGIVAKNGLTSNVLSVLNLASGSSSRQLGGFIMRRESGDEYAGTWVQDIDVKPGLMPGVYALSIFPLTDNNQNSTSFLKCPGQDVSYGVAEVKPTPIPTITQSPPQGSDVVTDVLKLKSEIITLKQQLKTLEGKLKKICAAKPKPKGC
jgi:hypothetical protein